MKKYCKFILIGVIIILLSSCQKNVDVGTNHNSNILNGGHILKYNGNFYYTSSKYDGKIIERNFWGERVLTNDAYDADYPSSDGKYLYFASFDENKEKRVIYKLNLKDKDDISKIDISDTSSGYLYVRVIDQWLYCANIFGLYRINTSSLEKENILNDWVTSLDIEDNQIICQVLEEKEEEVNPDSLLDCTSKIIKMGMDGSNKEELLEMQADFIDIKNNNVYFINFNFFNITEKKGDRKIYRYDLSSGELEKVSDEDVNAMNISGGYIYYQIPGMSETFYRMKIDGSDKYRIPISEGSRILTFDNKIYSGGGTFDPKTKKVKIFSEDTSEDAFFEDAFCYMKTTILDDSLKKDYSVEGK